MDYGYANYAVLTGAKAGDNVGEIPVSRGEHETVRLEVSKDVTALMKKGGTEPELTYELSDVMCAPVEKGVKAGEAVYTLDGEVVARVDVVTSEAVDRASLGTVTKKIVQKLD